MGSWSLVAVVVAACVGALGWALGVPPATEVVTTPVVQVEARGIVVHVTGAVAEPGLVSVPEGARVADAVRRAGGLLPDAEVGAINLARAVADGEQVVVPDGGAEAPGSTGQGLLAVNTATAAELEAIPGVGPVLAGRIVAHREERGPFATIEDLLGVSGIGERVLESLRDHIRVP